MRELLSLKTSIERLNAGQTYILKTLGQADLTNLPTPDLISVSSFTKSDDLRPISAVLSPELILLFHRLACFDLPTRIVGRSRTTDVWLGDVKGERADHVQPPPTHEVPGPLSDLCVQWQKEYSSLRTQEQKLKAVAVFHARFLMIHPFTDGNGRSARAILMQQCLDLFNRADMTLMNKGSDYYTALKAADASDYKPLMALILPIVQH